MYLVFIHMYGPCMTLYRQSIFVFSPIIIAIIIVIIIKKFTSKTFRSNFLSLLQTVAHSLCDYLSNLNFNGLMFITISTK